MGLKNAQVIMDGGGGLVWKSFMTNYPGLTDDSVPETTSRSYFCLGALKKESVCFHIECNALALFPEDINVNVQMLCMLKCH